MPVVTPLNAHRPMHGHYSQENGAPFLGRVPMASGWRSVHPKDVMRHGAPELLLAHHARLRPAFVKIAPSSVGPRGVL
jgi:hypothetical protein